MKKAGRCYAEAREMPLETYRCPATTAAFAVLSQDEDQHTCTMTYAHIGDCRIYLLRKGEAMQRLTDDDGLLTLLLHEGKISRDDLMRIDQVVSPLELDEADLSYYYRRNKITQALGWEDPLEPHIHSMVLLPGDRILLCTDGIHDNLTDQKIATVLRQRSKTGIARTLVQQAQWASRQEKSMNFRAKADDMSAVMIAYQGLRE